MNCDEFKDMLDAYAAYELDDSAMAAVRRHLEECPRCAADVEDFRAVLTVLRDAAGEAPLADRQFHRGLQRRLDEADLRLSRRHEPVVRWHFIGGVAAAAAAVLIVATVLAPHWIGAGDEGAFEQAAAPEMRPVIFYVTGPAVPYKADYLPALPGSEGEEYPGNLTSSPFLFSNHFAVGSPVSRVSFDDDEYLLLREQVRRLEERVKSLEAQLDSGTSE